TVERREASVPRHGKFPLHGALHRNPRPSALTPVIALKSAIAFHEPLCYSTPLLRTLAGYRAPMPKPRAAKLETPTARRRLAVRKNPYWTTISPGIHLGYRRNAGAGTWSVRVADSGAEWVKRIAVADDLEPASPPHVLSYWQAIDLARSLARRQPGHPVHD